MSLTANTTPRLRPAAVPCDAPREIDLVRDEPRVAHLRGVQRFIVKDTVCITWSSVAMLYSIQGSMYAAASVKVVVHGNKTS